MNRWDAEPLWETLDRLRAVHQVRAADTLGVTVTEYARLPRLAGRGYRGLDMLRSQLRQGVPGVIIRRR
jgi:hypothetical protein